MTLLQLQHHMTSLTITDRMRRAKSVEAIKEEMAGKLKWLSNGYQNKPAYLIHQVSFELGYADLGASKYSRTYKSVSKAGWTSGRINTGELDSQSRRSGAKRVNGRTLTCRIQPSCPLVGNRE